MKEPDPNCPHCNGTGTYNMIMYFADCAYCDGHGYIFHLSTECNMCEGTGEGHAQYQPIDCPYCLGDNADETHSENE